MSSPPSASSSRMPIGVPASPPPPGRRASSSSNPLLRSSPPALHTPGRAPYHSHPGCPLCGIVSAASTLRAQSMEDERPLLSPGPTTAFLPSPDGQEGPASPAGGARASQYSSPFDQNAPPASSSGALRTTQAAGRDVVFRDDDITVVRAAGKERLVDGGRHLLVILNKHVENVYDLGPSDIPILSHIFDTSRRILSAMPLAPIPDAERGGSSHMSDLRVGFVGPISKDPQSPHAHLHAHATMGPYDPHLPGASFWRRNVVFGSMNWWDIEDLRAEIRESTSNNRVKSGYESRGRAPIDRVPDAGSVAGLPNALDPDPYTDTPTPDASQFLLPLPHPVSSSAPVDRGGTARSRSQTGSGSASGSRSASRSGSAHTSASGSTFRSPSSEGTVTVRGSGKGKHREQEDVELEYQDVDLGVGREA